MVDRETEFGPVKNANGPALTAQGLPAEPLPDTPAYARKLVLQEASAWLARQEEDGLKVAEGARGKIEVSFLLSYTGENLTWLKRVQRGKAYQAPGGYVSFDGFYERITEQPQQ